MATEDNDEEEKPIHYEAGIPIFSPTPKDKDAEEKERRKAEQSHKTKELSLQGRILWTQIGLVFFGLIGSGVSIWQAHIAQQSADTSDRAILIAQKTERESRLASDNQYQLAKESLQVNIENFRKDERPYLAESRDGVTKPVIYANPFIPGKVQIAWTWEVENFGKTPVRNFTMYQYMKLRDGDFIPSYGSHGQVNGKAHDSGGSQPPGVKSKNSIFSRPMTAQEANAILASNEGVSIRVRVIYQDLEGDTYETSLCYQVDGRGGMVANCKQYNYIR